MNRNGFTLVELIVIIVILSILAIVVLPKYFDFSKRTERAIAENLVGTMRSALTIYYSQFMAKQKGTPKNFRDNISIPTFVKVRDDTMGMKGSEALILERNVTSRFVIDNPSSIKDYDVGEGGRHLRFIFKSGAILDIYYDREKPALDADYTGFN
jgi:prepilin-type N-terminal cleavage/methylation domain-containing protein